MTTSWADLPLDGLSEWSAGNYGDVPVDAGSTTTTIPRPHFSPNVEKYRAQAEQDLGNPSEVDAYLKSLEGGNEPAPNERERQRRLRIQSQQEADTQAMLATQTAPLSLAEKLQRTTTPLSAYSTIADALTPAPVGNALESVKSAVGDVANPVVRAGVSAATGGPAADVASAVGGENLPVIGDVLAKRRALLNQAGGVGGAAAESLVPTTLPDLALTAAPFLGKAGEAATTAAGAGKSLLEKRALEGLGPEASNLLEFPGGRSALSQVRYPGIAGAAEDAASVKRLADAKKTYEALKASGMTDAEIAANPMVGERGLIMGRDSIDTAAQITTRLDTERAASEAAARRNYNRVIGPDAAEERRVIKDFLAKAPETGKVPATEPYSAGRDSGFADYINSPDYHPQTQSVLRDGIESAQEAISTGQKLGYSDADIAAYLRRNYPLTADAEATAAARRAANQAPENLPAQQPNVPYNPDTASEMAAASPRQTIERIGTGEDVPVPQDTTRLYRGEQPFDKTIPDPPWGSTRGKSFTDDLTRAQQYANEGGRIRYVDVPNSELAAWEHKPATDRYLAPDNFRQRPGLQWGETGATAPNEPPTSNLHSGLPVSPPQHWNALDEALGALGVPQTVMASADIGQIGRQAQVLGWSNPKEYLDSVKQGIKAYASEEAAQAADVAVKASPAYDFAKQSGLHFYEVGPGVASGERVPGFGGLGGKSHIAEAMQQLGPVKASERSLATTLNVQGMQVFEKYGDAMVQAGITDQKQFDALARVINHARGYGTGAIADMTASSNAFFSARNLVSRFQVLMDPVLAEGSLFTPSARQLAAKNLAAFITGQTAMMGLLGVTGALAGGAWSVNADPRSGDFGQLRIGNTRIDTLAGFGPIAKLFARVGSEGTDTVAGTSLAKPSADWRQSVVSFFRNKEAPIPALVTSILSGKDNLGKPFQMTPEVLAQMFLPFIVNDVREAVINNEGQNKLLAAPTAAASMIGLGTQTYGPNLTELRDSAARKGVQIGNQLVKADSYQAIGPTAQGVINNLPDVQQYMKENPSPYQQSVTAGEQSIPIQEARRAEQSFKTNQPLAKALPEYWQDENVARLQMSTDLQKQFADTFSNFDKSKYDEAVKGYYDKQVRDSNNNPDFEATDVARQEYVDKLPPDQQEWIKQALQISRENKTPEHTSYLNYLDQKKAKGYFAKDITQAEKTALDRANPALDVQQWYWRGNVQSEPGGAAKPGPSLNSLDAVQQALALDPKRPVTYQNVPRAINKDAKSLDYWSKTAPRVDYYVQGGDAATQKEALAYLAGNVKEWGSLTSDEQLSRAKTLVRDSIVKDPAYDATLIWWGVREKIPSQEVYDSLMGIINKYGPMYKKAK